MIFNLTAQNEIISFLNNLVSGGILPADTKIDTYSGQIDVIKLIIEAGKFPAILVAWQLDSENEFIVENREDQLEFSLLICTDSASGLDEALEILDILKQHFFGAWVDDEGNRLFDVFRGPARVLFNLKRKQVISLRIRIAE